MPTIEKGNPTKKAYEAKRLRMNSSIRIEAGGGGGTVYTALHPSSGHY